MRVFVAGASGAIVLAVMNDLLQVMPWLVYQGMIDRDRRAIDEYLRAIPPREGGPEE